MTATFRLATRNDLDLLTGLVRRLYEHEEIDFDASAVRHALNGLVDDPSLGGAWLISAGGTVAGYMVLTEGYSLERGGRIFLLDELYIDADHRGAGLGTEALNFAVRQCRSTGVRAIHLEVATANESAQRLYRREGFGGPDRSLLTRLISPHDDAVR
jgi:ribosomal protein S18 acetylase RimI-like enzyme